MINSSMGNDDKRNKNLFEKKVNGLKFQIKLLEKRMFNHSIHPEKAFRIMKGLTNKVIMAGEKITACYKDKNDVKAFKSWFRGMLKDHIYQGELIKRGFEKPRGYAGDYKTIEAAYINIPWTKLGAGYFWDRYMLEDDYIESVRRRKDTIKKILREFLENSKGEKNILNMGSGSGREIRELFCEGVQYKDKINFILLDQDGESLDFIRSEIKKINYPTLNCNYVKENIVFFIRKIEQYIKQLGKQDLVYSIGVADYLGDALCVSMFEKCFKILKKCASFYVAFKLVKKYKSYGSDWCCDWNFYERSEGDIRKLIKESLSGKKYKIKTRYADERIVFCEINKI